MQQDQTCYFEKLMSEQSYNQYIQKIDIQNKINEENKHQENYSVIGVSSPNRPRKNRIQSVNHQVLKKEIEI